MSQREAQHRELRGVVVSDKGDKTVIVAVERKVLHPVYRKAYSVTKKFPAHDAANAHKVGDTVTIQETRPLSATKRFKVVPPA